MSEYIKTGDPAGSRSMTLTVRYPDDVRTVPAIDAEGLWVTVFDEEGMECEVTISGLTLPLMRRVTADTDRYNARGEKYSRDEGAPMTAMGLLRASMSRYLDMPSAGHLGAMALLIAMVETTLGKSGDDADEWLAEELQEMLAARG